MRTQRTIRNCTVRIETPCPKRWEELAPTDAAGTRHCSVCVRDVYFCSSDEETIEHARAGHCIAREEPDHGELPHFMVGRVAVPPTPTAEEQRAEEMTRRERGIDTLLRGRLGAASRPCPGCRYPVPNFRKSCYVCGLVLGRG